MRIKVLSENTSYDDRFGAEHGLSLYIETEHHKILFDFGQSNLFEKNAHILDVDLSEVDIAILSHGHYDHSGGLKRFLEINKKAPVYMSKYAFEPHYSGGDRYIGMDQSLIGNGRFVYVEDECQIDDDLSLYSCNREIPTIPVDCAGLGRMENGVIVPEDFRHEQYLVIRESGKRIVISGCSHKGIINITNYLKPDTLIGGFHFSKIELNTEGEKRLSAAAKYLMETGAFFYTCHCTGVAQYEYMKEIMGDRLRYLAVGDVIYS